MLYHELVDKLEGLNNNEEFNFTIGLRNYKNELRQYSLSCYQYGSGNKTYHVSEKDVWGGGMNVEKITPSFVKLFSYDIFGNKQSFNLRISSITLI